MLTRIFKRLWLFAALPLMLVAALGVSALYWIIATESGTAWVLTKAAGDQASFQSLTGTLAEGVDLRELRVKSPQMAIDIGSIASRWTLWSILGGQLTIDAIAVDRVAIHLYEDDSSKSDNNPWPTLRVPLPINIGSLSLSQLSITTENSAVEQNKALVEISAAHFKGIINPLQSHIQGFSLTTPEGNIEISGRISNQFPYGLSLKTAWQLTAGDEKTFSGTATINGALTKLNINHQLNSPVLLTTEATLVIATSAKTPLDVAAITADIRNQWQDINMSALVADSGSDDTVINSSGSLALTGSATQYQLAGNVQFQALPNPENTGSLLQSLDHLDLSIDLQGNLSSAVINTFSLASNQGSAQISGSIDWQQWLKWQAEISADNLDTGTLLKDWPGSISANIDSDGSWHNNQLQTRLHITRLAGTVGDHQLQGHGKVAVNKNPSSLSAEIDDLGLTLGANELSVAGIIGSTSALNWRLKGADLSALGDEFSGSLVGEGSIKGNLNDLITPPAQGDGDPLNRLSNLAIAANIEGDHIKTPGGAVDHIKLLATRNDPGQYQLAATATGLSVAGISNGNLQLDTNGAIEQHNFSLIFKDDSNHLRLAGNGGYLDQRWRGNITQLDLDNDLAGAWILENSAPLAIAAEAVELSRFCLQQNASSACVEISYSKGEIDTSGQLRNIDLSRLKEWLPVTTHIEGTLDGSFSVAGNTTRLSQLRSQYQLSSRDGALAYELENNQRIEQAFHFSIEGASAAKSIRNNAQLSMGDIGQLDLVVSLGFADERPLSGNLSGNIDSLQWLQAITTAVEDPEGSIHINGTISGTLSNPQTEGALRVDALAATLPALGIKLHQGSGQLLLNRDKRWQLNTRIFSGENPLTISGEGMFPLENDSFARLRIQGDNVSLVDLPTTRADFSPNLDIAISRSALAVSGKLGVPRARLVIKPQPEGITTVSKDEVVSSSEPPSQTGFAFKTDLLLALGDDVRLDAYGLSTGVRGELNLRQQRAGLPNARGTLALHQGSYEAYGQKLSISRGFLIFQGALDNPGLNIIASRKTPTATVGVEIGGTAQNIKSNVFSDPTLPATETLTLLVTGKLPRDLNQSDTNQVANAATALGISQSDWITSRLQSSLGLDVVSLEGGDSYTDSSLVVGKYLSSKLFVSYIQNLFSPQGSFALQYQIGDKLGLKAESGETQSIDLLYRIEH
ncbi:MAG: translocation/assembly module TamB domain-containing protein [Porticoccaceae bacterium]|nr:translocation/assembly module TamB domain-containing protein [Porticoccaceae bacterium]